MKVSSYLKLFEQNPYFWSNMFLFIISFFSELNLVLLTTVVINNTVVLRCTGDATNESWYLKKGNDLLIDDGSVNSDFSHYKIRTNHTMSTMNVEFKTFNEIFLDQYICFRVKGATSNKLDLDTIYKNGKSISQVNVRHVRRCLPMRQLST